MPTYTPAQLARFPWIASGATLRLSDLSVAFNDTLHAICSLTGTPISAYLTPEDLRLLSVAAEISRHTVEQMSDKTRDRLGYLLESLIDSLNTVAPLGFRFGAHEGDGALFGFWPWDVISEQMEALNFLDDSASLALILQDAELMGVDLDCLADLQLSVTGDIITAASARDGDTAWCGYVDSEEYCHAVNTAESTAWPFSLLLDRLKGYEPEPSDYPGSPRWLTFSSGSDDGAPYWQSPFEWADTVDGTISASLSVHRPDNCGEHLWCAICASLGYVIR
jgi:hypothetical protein